jgi:hypothetical protein
MTDRRPSLVPPSSDHSLQHLNILIKVETTLKYSEKMLYSPVSPSSASISHSAPVYLKLMIPWVSENSVSKEDPPCGASNHPYDPSEKEEGWIFESIASSSLLQSKFYHILYPKSRLSKLWKRNPLDFGTRPCEG